MGCDAFGNYFLQALMDIFSLENLELFLDLIKNFFTNMCINQHGTRVIQKTIEKVASNKNLVAKIENILNCNDLGIIIKSGSINMFRSIANLPDEPEALSAPPEYP